MSPVFKCRGCGLPTNGSQYHRSCWYDSNISEVESDDETVSIELFCSEGPLESSDDEEPLQEVCEVAPITANVVAECVQSPTIKVCVDVAGKNLLKNYNHAIFGPGRNYVVRRYLNIKCPKFDFMILYNNFVNDDIVDYPNNAICRMIADVWVNDKKSYHFDCVKPEDARVSKGFALGQLRTECDAIKDLVDMAAERPFQFFCNKCDMFLFAEFDYYSDVLWKAIYDKECDKRIVKTEMKRSNSYAETTVYTLIAVVKPLQNE